MRIPIILEIERKGGWRVFFSIFTPWFPIFRLGAYKDFLRIDLFGRKVI